MRRMFFVIGMVFSVSLLVGCGGGGGGGSSSPYTGLTTPAVIDNTTAVEIALGAYYGGEMMDTSFLPGVLGVRESGSAAPPPFNILALVRTLEDVTDSLGGQSQASAMTGPARPLTVWSDSGRIPEGAVDNYMGYSLSWNDQTGAFSGEFSFHNYGDGEGGFLNGSISATGTTSIYYNPDPQPGDFLEITFRFSSVTSTDGINTVTISGSMTLANNVPAGTGSATMNLYVSDGATGETSRINYKVTTTGETDGIGAYTDVTISAESSICLHNHGCVDVATEVPFRTYDAYSIPSSGVLVVTGEGGRRARLVVIDGIPESPGYFVEADLDANGSYEWVSPDFPWV